MQIGSWRKIKSTSHNDTKKQRKERQQHQQIARVLLKKELRRSFLTSRQT